MTTSESLESLAVSFDRFQHVEGKAERTRVLYRQSTDYFNRWLETQDLAANLDNFTRENVLGWLESLRKRELTDGTILTRWRGLRRFTNWLLSEQIIHTDPLAGIAVDKPEAPSVPILTDEELSARLGACSGRSFNDLRDAVPSGCSSTVVCGSVS